MWCLGGFWGRDAGRFLCGSVVGGREVVVVDGGRRVQALGHWLRRGSAPGVTGRFGSARDVQGSAELWEAAELLGGGEEVCLPWPLGGEVEDAAS